MSWKTRLRPSPALGVALAALLVAVGGVAFASIPGPDGVVKGCYSNTDGALRVIDSAQSCDRNETELSLLSPAGLDFERPYVSFVGNSTGVVIRGEGGIQSVKRVSRGKYCVRPMADFDPIEGTATAEYSNTANGLAIAFVKTVRPDCPQFSLEIVTGRLLNGVFTPADNIVANGDPTG